MGKIPKLKPGEVEKHLLKMGFIAVRQKGSHKQDRHSDERCTTVPLHLGRDISPVLLKKIAKDIDVQVEMFSDKI